MNSTLDLLWTWGLVLVLIAGWCVFWLFGRHVGRKLENAKAIASTPSEGRSDTLTLVRAVDPTNFLRKFSVFIDDVKVGYIGAGEARHYPLSQGVHRVAVKVDFCKSRELTIEKLPEKKPAHKLRIDLQRLAMPLRLSNQATRLHLRSNEKLGRVRN
jgi:hypothetical protein